MNLVDPIKYIDIKHITLCPTHLAALSVGGMTVTIHKFGCIWTVCNLTKYDFGLHFYNVSFIMLI
jgi:hypothetical protein